MRASTGLALLAVAIVAGRWMGVPVLDEESYLDIASQLDPLRPYDWWRPWPPWGAAPAATSYLYAHPPGFLWWVWGWGQVTGDVALQRVLCAMPWAAVLGAAVGRLAEDLTRRPFWAGALALSAPISALALQRGLMPDLQVTALATVAALGWWRGTRGWLVLGGVALAAAAFTKYPALLLIPALILHGAATGRLRKSAPFWLTAAALWVAGEGWLWAIYGRPHLVEVLATAGSIPRGPMDGRALGALVRAGFGVLPLALLGQRRVWLPAAALGAAAMAWGWPDGVTDGGRLALIGLAIAGAAGFAFAGAEAARRDAAGRLLGAWAVLVLLGVIVGHNFAAPRYLLPAVAPIALLVARRVDDRWLRGAVALQAALAAALCMTEAATFKAAARVGAEVAAAFPDTGAFTGEWALRWRLQQAGWRFAPDKIQSETLFVIPKESSPGISAPEGWEAAGHFAAGVPALRGMRVLDAEDGVGFYAETLGPLPLGWRSGPLEEATAWRAP